MTQVDVASSRRPGTHRSNSRVASWVVTVRNVPTGAVLLGLVAALCVIGLIMVGSASSVISISLYGTPWAILIREIMWMVIGLAALAVAMRVDYRRWRRLSSVILIITFVMLVVVLVPGLGVHAEGSSRWIGFGQFRVQPSELMKLALVLFGADLITRRLDEGSDERRLIGPLLIVAALAGLLILAQPDMGTAMVLGCITMALLFCSGVRLRPVMKIVGTLIVLALLVGLFSPYRRARLLSFIDPSSHGSTSGYQVSQSLIGLGSGHLFGLGLGSGHQKWGSLPNAHTDFIFSVVGEELGLVGALAVLILLGAFAWFGLRAVSRAPDRFGALVALGLVAWITAETIINVGAVIGVLPVTGIPLPFISFGGSSLVITMVAAGILINIARQENTGQLTPVTSTRRRTGSHRAPTSGTGRPSGAGR